MAIWWSDDIQNVQMFIGSMVVVEAVSIMMADAVGVPTYKRVMIIMIVSWSFDDQMMIKW